MNAHLRKQYWEVVTTVMKLLTFYLETEHYALESNIILEHVKCSLSIMALSQGQPWDAKWLAEHYGAPCEVWIYLAFPRITRHSVTFHAAV